MTEFNHFVLTRFNMREDIANPKIPSDKWHQDRFDLFEKFCLPSIQLQTNTNFKWLVFFDVLTPEKFLPKIKSYTVTTLNFIPIFSDNLETFREHIEKYIDNDIEYLITTRIDNDDAIGKDFIRDIQKKFNYQRLEFINFSNGYILHSGKLYQCTDKSNAFLSLVEKIDHQYYRTVWCVMHHKASSIANILQIENNRAWMQVIHTSNVTNRVKGVRNRDFLEVKDKFNVNFIEYNNPINYYVDVLFFSPLRITREIVFQLLKKTMREGFIRRLKYYIKGRA